MSADLARLSEREREVLRLLARGHDLKSVASELGVSNGAVNERLREARRKLGVGSSREAARLLAAQEAGYSISVDTKSGIERTGWGGDDRRRGSGRISRLAIPGIAMLALLLSAAALWTASDHKTDPAASQAPRVVATSPRPGSAIAPGPFMLSVTFDRPMMEGSYSIVQKSAETFPQCGRGAALSGDRRIVTVRCAALAGRAYEIWFNSPPYMNFKSASGVPAQPFQLRFKTRAR